MDNFMDKLAKRFNAGELIQANGEAEARENERLKEQISEYDKVMQEVRRLNLKTIEVSEQVSQMAACSIEQIESYQPPVQAEDFSDDYSQEFETLKEDLAKLRESMEQMETLLADSERRIIQNCVSPNDEDAYISLSRKIDESAGMTRKRMDDMSYHLDASFSQFEHILEDKIIVPKDDDKDESDAIRKIITEEMTTQQEATKQIKEMIVSVRLYLDEVQKHIEDYVHKENVKVYRNVQAVVNEQLSVKTRDLNDHMDQIEKEVESNKSMKGMLLLLIIISGASLALEIVKIIGIL